MLYVVRHAHAGNKRAWEGPDDLRPLSERGRLHAGGLVGLLAPYPVASLLTSPTTRCRQTLEPLAEARKLPIEDEPDLGVDAPLERLLALMRRPGIDGAALCSHGELIGALIEHLVAGGAKLDAEARWPKGSVWLISGFDGASNVRGRYLDPVTD
jgi:broad specificity phosphatase PhoE